VLFGWEGSILDSKILQEEWVKSCTR